MHDVRFGNDYEYDYDYDYEHEREHETDDDRGRIGLFSGTREGTGGC